MDHEAAEESYGYYDGRRPIRGRGRLIAFPFFYLRT
jgi:hypothetical protein